MPVTKAKWLTLPAASRGKLTYQQYVQWANRRTALRKKASTARADFLASNPLAPLTQAEVNAQAHQQVTANTQPLINQIIASIGRTRKAGVADINQATGQAVAGLTPLAGQIGSAFDYSQGQVQHGTQAMADFLKNAGLADQANVAAQLQAAGQGAPQENLGTIGAQAGGMAMGYGQSAGDLLAQQRASEVSLARQAPGIAQRQGVQNITKLERDLANQQADEIGQITGQVPGMVNTAYQSLLEREYNKAVAARGFAMDTQKLQEEKRQFNKQNETKAAQIPKIDTAVSNNANDGFARDANGYMIPDGHGGYITWNKTTPKGSGGGGGAGSKFQQRVDRALPKVLKMAQDIRKTMLARVAPDPTGLPKFSGANPKKQAHSYIIAQRQAALQQVYSYWKSQFPNPMGDPKKNQEWWAKQTAGTLSTAGFKNLDLLMKPLGGGATGGGKPKTGPVVTAPGGAEGAPGGGLTGPAGAPGGTQTGINQVDKRTMGGLVRRIGALQNNKVPKERAYGMAVNYLLRTSYAAGHPIGRPAAARVVSEAFNQLGITVGGNPTRMDQNFQWWNPPKRPANAKPGQKGFVGPVQDTHPNALIQKGGVTYRFYYDDEAKQLYASTNGGSYHKATSFEPNIYNEWLSTRHKGKPKKKPPKKYGPPSKGKGHERDLGPAKTPPEGTVEPVK